MKKAELDAVIAPLLQAATSLNTIAARQDPVAKAAQTPGGGTPSVTSQITNALAEPLKAVGKSFSNIISFNKMALIEGGAMNGDTINPSAKKLIEGGFKLEDLKNKPQELEDAQWGILTDNFAAATTEVLAATASMLILVDTTKLLFGELVKEFKAAFTDVSNFQIKAIAANIEPVKVFSEGLAATDEELETFKYNLKSTAIEFQQEILKFRDVGISKLDLGTAKLVDKMVFTGQKVGTLATFLSNNAAAIGMNTDQAMALALNLDKVASEFQIQQDTLFEVAQSIKEFSVKMAAIAPGLGGNIEKLMGTLVPQFGLQLGDSVKSMLSLFDPKNLVLITQLGLQDVYEKIRAGTATSEDLKLASQKLVEFADKQLATEPGLVGDFMKTQFFKTFGISDQEMVAARALSDAAIKEGKDVSKTVFENFGTLKDLTNRIRSEMQGFVTELGNVLGKTGAIDIAKDLVNQLSKGAKSMFGKLIGGLLTELNNTTGATFDLSIPGLNTIKIPREGLRNFLKNISNVEGADDAGKLDLARRKQIDNLKPEGQSVYQSASLAQFTEMNQSLKEANGLKRMELARRSLISPPNMTTA
jgi:hypothetical protein